MQNSAIALDVTKTSNNFYISGAASKITVSGESSLLNDGSAILDGQFLIGSSGDNSFNAGGITAGNGLIIQSGAGVLRMDVGLSGIAPTSGSLLLPASANVYGGTNAFLGTPSAWLSFALSGVSFKIPLYL